MAAVPFRAAVRLGEYELEPGYVVTFINREAALSGYLSVAAALDGGLGGGYERKLVPLFREYAVRSIAPDGSGYRVLVGKPDGSFAEMDPRRTKTNVTIGPPPWNDLACRTDGPYRYGGAASAAAVCALVRMAAYDGGAAAWVREHAAETLALIADGHMSGIEDPHGLFPAAYVSGQRNRSSGEAIAFWLWAYWSMRTQANPS